MKPLLYSLLIALTLLSCVATQNSNTNTDAIENEDDIVTISNDNLEYDIIIIEPGFNTWLDSSARPEGYYSQPYLETKNRIYVNAWNQRVNLISSNKDLYEMQIDYNSSINYGYELNYKLYNYFVYFQITHNQKLAGAIPRI
ncbi:DUF6146 family protein [Lacinutrix undariae]